MLFCVSVHVCVCGGEGGEEMGVRECVSTYGICQLVYLSIRVTGVFGFMEVIMQC